MAIPNPWDHREKRDESNHRAHGEKPEGTEKGI
jgi:hypothetical protein